MFIPAIQTITDFTGFRTYTQTTIGRGSSTFTAKSI
jgi:hypothetical protein